MSHAAWLHRILGVDLHSDTGAMRTAYGAMLRSFHPDRCPDTADNRRRLALIHLAHQVLRDPALRAEHARTGKIPEDTPAPAEVRRSIESAGLVELARGFLNAFRNERPANGRERLVPIDLSTRELLLGTSRVVEVHRMEACGGCEGSGSESDPPPLRCHVCLGSGTLAWRSLLSRGMACPFCNRKGVVVRAPCARCGGEGYRCVQRPFRLRIPAGVREGERIVLKGEGERGRRGGRHGDLAFELRLDRSEPFERDGLDLLLHVEVQRGASSVRVPHPEGALDLALPEDPDGAVLVARGLGLPDAARPEERGDLRVLVRWVESGTSGEAQHA